MSGDSVVVHRGAAPAERPPVLWSALRAVVYGLGAAGVSAGAYTGTVVLTGYDLGLVFMLFGLVVGVAVSSGHARLPDAWIRTLSVLLTLLGLVLASYLLMWLYDGEGLAPRPISVGEVLTTIWNAIYDEPVRLLFWGIALLTAFGVPDSETSADAEDEESDTRADDPTRPLVQLVRATPNPVRAADLKLVVVLPALAGGCRLRWVDIAASDLPAALPHLYDRDPTALEASADLAPAFQVVDRDYDSVEAAKVAALDHPNVDPEEWLDEEDLASFVEQGSDFTYLLTPDAQRPGAAGATVAWVIGLVIAACLVYAGLVLNVAIGLDTPEMKGTLPDSAFTVGMLAVAGLSGIATGRWVARVLGRHNLAKAVTRAAAPSTTVDGHRSPQESHAAEPVTCPPLDPAEPRFSHLIERPKIRFFWCGILTACSTGLIAVSVALAIPSETASDPLTTWALGGVGLFLLGAGLLVLRVGIGADERGVRVIQAVGSRTVSWGDLEDVVLVEVQSPIQVGFHQLALVKRDGKVVTTSATGPGYRAAAGKARLTAASVVRAAAQVLI